MGQKIHPTGFRLSVTRNWSSKWYANSKTFANTLFEDLKVREYLKKRLAHASVGKVTIERPAKNARITIHSARPGVVIGKKGEDIETLRAVLRKMMGVEVGLNIEEIRKPEIDAKLIADSIAQQLEKRIMFRRAMKRAMQNAMRLGAQGIKIMSSGRLNGIEIARSEWYREGRVPLHTLRADIDYGFSEAMTQYGAIGIKVWVFKGEVLAQNEAPVMERTPNPTREPRKDAPAPAKRVRKPRSETIVTVKEAAPAADAAPAAAPATARSRAPTTVTVKEAAPAAEAAATAAPATAKPHAETTVTVKQAAPAAETAPAATPTAAKE
jgi:small subunit ribosomal protein S3